MQGLNGAPRSRRPVRSTAVLSVVSAVVAWVGPMTGLGLVVITVMGQTAAFGAVTGGDSSNGTLTVGASDGGSTPGSPGAPGGRGAGSGATGPWTCNATSLLLNDEGGFAPGGPTPGGWYSVTCENSITGASTTQTEWLTSQVQTGTPVIDPRTLALQAENSLRLPSPTLHFNPTGSSVVNLPTWLWIDPSVWHSYSVTVAVGTVSVSAVATPSAVVWQMGDGGGVSCAGPGRAFDVSRPARTQVTACAYRYRSSSLGQASADGNPDGAAYPVRATVNWAVTWSATGAEGGGTLPPLATSASSSLRVVQVESVDTGYVGLSGMSDPSSALGGRS